MLLMYAPANSLLAIPRQKIIKYSAPPHQMTEKLRPTAEIDPQESADNADMAATATGDTQAFAKIVTRWQAHLINFFYRSVGNRSDAEDLAQETFLNLFRAAPRYEARNTFKAFLFTLARRRMIDHQRKSIRRPLDFMDPTDWPLQQNQAPQDNRREVEHAFHQALHALPDKQRAAILLLQQQNLSYEEIAHALDTSVSSVKTWIFRARTHLREALKDYHQS